MKKFLILATILSVFSVSAKAQDAGESKPTTEKHHTRPDAKLMEEKRAERLKDASPEERAAMEKRRDIMKSLSPEKREAVKKEMERHRAEMKKITGFEPAGPRPEMGHHGAE